jgi:1-acyl-sn-glycerol-3-phosphate acyltransferase
MIYIRTILFNFAYIFLSLFWSIALLWALLLPKKTLNALIRNTYFWSISIAEKYILGLTYKIEGVENIPKEGGYILAAKHQSAFETLKIPLIIKSPAIILKKELTFIPLWGLYPICMGHIAIDRGSAKVALKSIVEGAKRVINDEKRPVLIFPEGTRTKPGSPAEYKSGVSFIYKAVEAPVVPLALDSGKFWGKNSFWKKSGCVTLKFLPPIQPGLSGKDFMKRLENDIETASNELLDKNSM